MADSDKYGPGIWYPDKENAKAAGQRFDSERALGQARIKKKIDTSRDTSKLPGVEGGKTQSAPTHLQPKSKAKKASAADIRRRKSRASIRKAKTPAKLETSRGETKAEIKSLPYEEAKTERDTSKLPSIEEKRVSSAPMPQRKARRNRLMRIAGKAGRAVKRGLTYAVKGSAKRPSVKV